MASAYSTPQQFDNYVAPVNLELVNFVLGSKEQKFNYNIAKVEQTLAEFGNLGLVRDQDKQYLADRINQAVGQMGDVTKMDWSDSNIERQITSGIRGSIDEKVINDIQMSKRYTGFMEQMKTMQEKQSDKFSETNMAYALHQSGVANWLNGESESFGNINYTPYQNVTEEYRKILDDSINLKRGITRQVEDPDNPGRYITTEHYGLTQKEIRDRVMATMTPEQRKQLEINSWGTYGDAAPQIYEQYATPKLEELNRKKVALEGVNPEGRTEAQKARDREELADLNRQIGDITARKESPSQLHQYLGTQGLIAGLSEIYAPVETKRTYQTNDVYFKNLDMAAKNASNVIGGDSNRNGSLDITTSARVTDTDEEFDFVAAAEQELNQGRQVLNQGINQALNRLDATQREAFDIGYQEFLKESGLDDNVSSKTEYLIEKSNGGKGNLLTASELAGTKNLLRDYNRKREIQVNNYNSALEELQEANLNSVFSRIKQTNNRSLRMLNENGVPVSMVDFIAGANSIDDLTPRQREAFLQSVYADITLSQTKDYVGTEGLAALNDKNNYNLGRLAKMFDETGEELPMLVNPNDIVFGSYSPERVNNDFERMKVDMQLPSQMTKEQFNQSILPIIQGREEVRRNLGPSPEEVFFTPHPLLGGIRESISKVYERFTTNLGKGMGLRSVDDVMIIGGEGTRTRSMLERAMEHGIYDDWSLGNDSVDDISDIRNVLDDRDKFNNLYTEKMKASAPNFASTQEVIVEASGTRQGEEVPAWENLITASKGMLNRRGGNIIVRDEGDYFDVRQVEKVTVERDGKVDVQSKIWQTKINKNDRSIQEGDFIRNIDFNNARERITTNNTKSINSEPITFADEKNHRSYLAEVAQMFGLNREAELAPFSEQKAKQSLVRSYPEVFQDPNYGPRMTELAEKMIDNSDLFRVNVEANTVGNFDIAIQYKGKENGQDKWLNLHSMETLSNDITDRMTVIDVAPSMVYYEYMHRLFNDISNRNMMAHKDQIRTLENLLLR